jgi:hypothetical protein
MTSKFAWRAAAAGMSDVLPGTTRQFGGTSLGARTTERNMHMIRKLASGQYRLYSRKKDPKTGKRRNLGTFRTRAAAEKHEREVQFFKRHG